MEALSRRSAWKVLVLYLDRPRSTAGSGATVCGRFGYSDLKEASLRSVSYVFSIGLWRVMRNVELSLRAEWVGRDRGLRG
jgi:hypothetical protein